MLTQRDLVKIRKWLVEVNGKIEFVFEKYRYKLVINHYIHAQDLEGNKVPWSRAFGPKIPADVLASFKVKEVKLTVGDRELKFKSIRELRAHLKHVLATK